MKEQEDRYWWY